MRPRVPLALGAALAASGCASPGDVQGQYDSARDSFESARQTYDADMAYANMWNEHVLGIPAAGWVAIAIVGAVLAAVLLGFLAWLAGRALAGRRRDAHELAMARERTVQAATERGPCPGCGLDVPTLTARVRATEGGGDRG